MTSNYFNTPNENLPTQQPQWQFPQSAPATTMNSSFGTDSQGSESFEKIFVANDFLRAAKKRTSTEDSRDDTEAYGADRRCGGNEAGPAKRRKYLTAKAQTPQYNYLGGYSH
jgi:hypothetical protein